MSASSRKGAGDTGNRDKTGTKNKKASETGKQNAGSGGSKSGGDKKKTSQ